MIVSGRMLTERQMLVTIGNVTEVMNDTEAEDDLSTLS